MKIFKTLITYGLFPIVFIGAMYYAYWGMESGKINEGILLASVAFAAAMITLVFEQIHPNTKLECYSK